MKDKAPMSEGLVAAIESEVASFLIDDNERTNWNKWYNDHCHLVSNNGLAIVTDNIKYTDPRAQLIALYKVYEHIKELGEDYESGFESFKYILGFEGHLCKDFFAFSFLIHFKSDFMRLSMFAESFDKSDLCRNDKDNLFNYIFDTFAVSELSDKWHEESVKNG